MEIGETFDFRAAVSKLYETFELYETFKLILNAVKMKYLLTLPVGILLTKPLSLRTAVLTMRLAFAKEMRVEVSIRQFPIISFFATI